ncbi:MAG TPA: tannase/feruloyl esterase family alpha/beta hydrolase [Bryobacteraceae bacterium]|nr:tannase/feruloyl esterase family alpha/beta hydrolase [Bryobacteraceae bacterium]
MKLAVFAVVAASPVWGATCESLSSLRLPDTSITIAESRPAGEFTPPNGGQPLRNLPAFCRVAGSIRPSSDSDIRFEVWMPSSGWNGKFQGVGNGGFAGAISFAGLADAVSHGYATASTDTGHQEKRGNHAEWALNHPEKIIDFGYRAIHETAVNAKAIIQAHYGDAPKRSYFNSCSNGGRQALMEAQRFPADYDGIIAGAPANYWTHLLSAAMSGVKATLAEPASYIPESKLPAIENAALAQCDAKDGVKDGVIENPRACHFDTSVLRCKGAETNECLTVAQLAALDAIYGGLKDSNGAQLFPGLSPGGEAERGGWASWVTGPAPEKSEMYSYGTQFFQNMVYSNPNWPFRTFDPGRDTRAADIKIAQYLNANNADLSAFHKRGGKLILYHGWSDAAIPASNSINYYQSVAGKMGSRETGAFIRLYMVPGMEHCGGGAGPNTFGQSGVAKHDPEHDIDAALEAWVEQGHAPDRIIASKLDQEGRAVRTRPLCIYPQVARWKKNGSTDDAANFVCAN